LAVSAVVFDFGYTLVNEDRVWRERAADVGVADSDFFAALGAVIERRLRHRDVFPLLGVPDSPRPAVFRPEDFYDDALETLSAARRAGHVVGIAGNTGPEIETFLAENVAVDFIASSASWGIEKPASGFFDRVVDAAGCAPGEITYVGDRLDNVVLPAQRAGMRAVWLLRGPWAVVQRGWPEARQAAVRADALDESLR
jgi:phosphoglycolate phosphatase-like HAD superfamily hydrolase